MMAASALPDRSLVHPESTGAVDLVGPGLRAAAGGSGRVAGWTAARFRSFADRSLICLRQ